nr:prephenate dehydrogenase/arogenate dehydrogenase family protein [Candidatus Dadabacteria bacterium]NIT13523.1 prephenate dehydrogenase/arogenate dehydrogenase family protein [Candidatus Dadabacteria bacterium]
HPIAGTEKSGVKNIVSGLFRDKITVITPTDNTSSRADGFGLGHVEAYRM